MHISFDDAVVDGRQLCASADWGFEHPGVSTIGSQLLDGDHSRKMQILATPLRASLLKEKKLSPITLINQ